MNLVLIMSVIRFLIDRGQIQATRTSGWYEWFEGYNLISHSLSMYIYMSTMSSNVQIESQKHYWFSCNMHTWKICVVNFLNVSNEAYISRRNRIWRSKIHQPRSDGQTGTQIFRPIEATRVRRITKHQERLCADIL